MHILSLPIKLYNLGQLCCGKDGNGEPWYYQVRRSGHQHHHTPARTLGNEDRKRSGCNWQSCLEGFWKEGRLKGSRKGHRVRGFWILLLLKDSPPLLGDSLTDKSLTWTINSDIRVNRGNGHEFPRSSFNFCGLWTVVLEGKGHLIPWGFVSFGGPELRLLLTTVGYFYLQLGW